MEIEWLLLISLAVVGGIYGIFWQDAGKDSLPAESREIEHA